MKTAILAILILATTAQARPWQFAIGQKTQVTKGLVAYWAFNGNANDELGVNNGTLEGSATTKNESGIVGQGLWLDEATSDFVEINGSYQGFNFSNQGFAVSFWINPSDWETTSTWKPIIVKRQDYNVKNDWGFWKDDTGGDLILIYGVDVQIQFTTDYTSVPEDKWTYMTWTRNGNYLELYLDGVFIEKQTLSATLSFNSDIPIKIGAANHPNEYAKHFDGSIDEVRIYNRSLSADEIKQLYRMGKTIYQNR